MILASHAAMRITTCPNITISKTRVRLRRQILTLFTTIKVSVFSFFKSLPPRYIANEEFCVILGYRDVNNLRKHKLPPTHHLPHPASLYHKHNLQHRHSPLHEAGFAVHSRSSSHSVHRPVSRVESPKQLNLQHQSTPLARLSPSSELSQQMPRILTLQVRKI